jgi:hypothetical protein
MAISTVSFKTVSEMAIVPDKLCKIPTLMVSAAKAGSADKVDSATAAVSALSVKRREFKDCMCATPKLMKPLSLDISPLGKPGFCFAMG